MKNIAIFGAFDINSFGDMLFPKAIDIELRKRIEINKIILFSPTDNKSEYSGDWEIYSYEKFEEMHAQYQFSAIIIGGGEMLHNEDIHFTSSEGKDIVYKQGETWKIPIKLGQKYHIRTIINGVGIPHTLSKDDREQILSCNYVSVRDKYSAYRFAKKFEEYGIRLIPDTLWNLDEYFKTILNETKKEEILKDAIGESVSSYAVLQMGTLDNLERIYIQAIQYCQNKGYKLVVFPINWCHDDKKAAELIEERYGSECIVLNQMLSVEQIITVISQAKVFVGTSFHGTLVALLAGVRAVIYNMYPHFVSKMDGLTEWFNERVVMVEDSSQIWTALNSEEMQEDFFTIVCDLKKRIAQHFDSIAEVINSECVKQDEYKELLSADIEYVEYQKSYLQWRDENGLIRWKKIFSELSQGKFKVCETIESVSTINNLSWSIKLDGIKRIWIEDLKNLFSRGMETSCLCYEKITQFKIEHISNRIEFIFYVQDEEVSGETIELVNNYRNITSYIALLEERECRNERQIGALVREKERFIREKEQLEEKYKQTTEELNQEIKNKEGHIALLLEVEREYEREKKSKTYRLALKFRKLSLLLFPVNSKRRFFAGMCKKVICNPKLMLHVINPRRIKNFFAVYKKEGMEGVHYHYQLVEEVENSRLNPFDANKFEVAQVEEEPEKSISDYEKLHFTVYEKPEVSIIIPVYNEFHYTYNCLSSIKKNSGDVQYEIIIADDCSSDFTMQLGEVAEGIRIIRNEKNLRFLLNCNHAAGYAKGKYILFLNNDTQVQENWLQPLVDVLEKDGTVGMTGSKLVYADGWLQEAGGIFWKDASAWNYGNRKNPDDPEFNYVKEADYISGASLMIRADLWKKIGGFDERFAPAYYEDSDLAFEVRKHGYKVVYQPLSVVVHFEGVSNGTDVTAGQKAYQVTNQQKFYEKWKDVLEKEHFPNAENVFLAKDRSRFKKQILVVDHYVPHYDKDAGGKCTYMYLLLFVKMGFKVTFIGDNFYKHEPYTTDLNQHGIEVLYGNYYYNNWETWLKENLHYFDYVYLQRPHISIKYIDLVKEYSHAKVLYFAHDLHHIREYREYELTGDEEKLKSSEHWKKIEYELFEKADVGHVVGTYEQAIMQKAFPDKPIRNIPLYIYENILKDINKNFEERKDILYVGGFGHPPNIDAVLWFGKEVFPRILEKYPDMKWHVVGGKVPLEVQEMASENILIEGFLSDEDLHKLYRTCRMAVVPLRVGAGVKGKVVEAAYFQIPLVTTTIGAEGLDDQMGNMVVEDDAEKMSNVINALYEDFSKLREMSDAGIAFIQKYFTEDEAERVVLLDIEKQTQK